MLSRLISDATSAGGDDASKKGGSKGIPRSIPGGDLAFVSRDFFGKSKKDIDAEKAAEEAAAAAAAADVPLKLETAPFDPRFPNMNQTKYCYQSFLDYHRCVKVKGDDYLPCEYFKKCYTSLCPNDWVDKWNSQIRKGTFAGRI